ncbi:MAG: type VI secretion system-associated protein TagF [Pararhodobacter sp.]
MTPSDAASSPPADTDAEVAAQPCSAGLFGKLPARGDFVMRNLPPDVLRPFEDWLMAVMRDSREILAEDWGRVWHQAAAWRFWIGGAALEGDWRQGFQARGAAAARATAVTGVLLPSSDRSGRHFPLVLLLADSHASLMPPPVVAAPDRDWYAACEQVLREARVAADLAPVESALAVLPAPRLPDHAAGLGEILARRSLWAVAGDAESHETALWADIAAVDHHLGAVHRSYWWIERPPGADSPGPGPMAALSLPGLPDPESFAFMLTRTVPEMESPS